MTTTIKGLAIILQKGVGKSLSSRELAAKIDSMGQMKTKVFLTLDISFELLSQDISFKLLSAYPSALTVLFLG